MKLQIVSILFSTFLLQARWGDSQTTEPLDVSSGEGPTAAADVCANVDCPVDQHCIQSNTTSNTDTECQCNEGYVENSDGACIEGDSQTTEAPEEYSGAEPTTAGDSQTTEAPEENSDAEPTTAGDSQITEAPEENRSAEPTTAGDSQTTEAPEENSSAEPTTAGDSQITEAPEENSSAEPTTAGDSQTTEAPEENSSAEPTTADTGGVETTAADVCANVPCPENQQCVPTENTASGTECQCSEGYVSSGGICVQGCASEQVVVLNSVVRQDVDCSNASYTPANLNITANFTAVATGSFSSADIECSQVCNERPREIGALECLSTGQWSEPTWTDCSLTQDQQTPEDQSDNALISTSDPEDTSSTDVENAVSDVNSVANSEEEISNEVVQTVVFVVSNVFRVTQTSAQGAVGNSLTTILDVLVIVSTRVTLTTDRGGATSWEFEVVNVAVCVIGFSTVQRNEAGDAKRIKRQTATTTWFYGPANDFNSDLSKSEMSLLKTEPKNAPYMSAATANEGRVIFTMFSEVDAFKLDEISGLLTREKVVYKFGGGSLEVTMKFQINRDITLDASNRFNESTTDGQTTYERLQVLRWNETDIGWIAADCHSYSAESGFAQATCAGVGEFTIASETVTEPVKTEVGLSAGQIAGIVIGSLVVGGAIIGLAVYLSMSKKKSVDAARI